MGRLSGVRSALPPHPWHSLQGRLLLWMIVSGLVTVAAVLFALNQGASRQFDQFVTRNAYSTLFQAATQIALAAQQDAPGELQQVVDEVARLHDLDIQIFAPDGGILAASTSANDSRQVLLPASPDPSRSRILLRVRDGELGMLYLLPADRLTGRLGEDLVSLTPADPDSWQPPGELFPGISIRSEVTLVQEVGSSDGTADEVVQSRTMVNQTIPLTTGDNQALFRGGLTRTLALTAAGALLLILALSVVLTRQMLRPIRALTAASREMQAGRLGGRVPVTGRDELGELALAFNSMAAQMEENVAALQRFVGDAAHELHTPLTALRTNLELAAAEPDESRRAAYMQRATRLVDRMTNVSRDLLDLSTLEAAGTLPERAPVDLAALLRETGELHASRAEQAGIAFDLQLPPEPVPVLGARTALRQALANLIDNAIKFTPAGGVVTVRLESGPEGTAIVVQDSGIGVAAADLPHLFDRFYRAGAAAPYPGSGLGLAIVRAVAEQHDGQVRVAATTEGTCFTLCLPPLPQSAAPVGRRGPRRETARPSERGAH